MPSLGNSLDERVSRLSIKVSEEEGTYGRATSKRFSMDCRTSLSWSVVTKEIARPLVPKRPARPTRCRYESASAGRS